MEDGSRRRGRAFRAARALLAAGARLVPPGRREAWRAEWDGELWALRERGRGATALVGFALGGIGSALWERRREEGTMGDGIGRDVRHALRRLGRTPGQTAVSVAVLALAIGATSALFGALKGAVLEPPPYPEPDRMVMVDMLREREPGAPFDTLVWSTPKFDMAREGLTTLDPLAGYVARTATLTGAGDPARIGVEVVSVPYFRLLGVEPEVGRVPTDDERPPARADVVVLGHGLWVERFGADPEVVGRRLELDGGTLEVVGVLPEGFAGLTGSADVWIPMAAAPTVFGARRLQMVEAHWHRAVGRLRPGVSLEQARSEAAAVGADLTRAWSGGDRGAHGVALVPFLRARVNPVGRAALAVAGGGAALLLLIACANVAGLFLARAGARRSDVAVRVALGASRGRVAREAMVESLIVAGAGAAGGLLLAVALERTVSTAAGLVLDAEGTRGLRFLDPATLGVDGGVLLFGALLAVVTGLLLGIAPARLAGRTDPAGALRAAAAVPGRRQGPVGEGARGLLVVGQLALTLVLLTGTGLMWASFRGLDAIALGFDPEGVLAARYELPRERSDEEVRAFATGLMDRLEAHPGVEAAALVTCAPLAGRGCERTGVTEIDDVPAPGSDDGGGLLTQVVTPGYFETVGVRALEGRLFPGSLTAADPTVVVLGRTAARELFPGESAVGHRVRVTHRVTPPGAGAEVIGVVDDVPYGALDGPPEGVAYFAHAQAGGGYGTLVVRTVGDPLDGVDAVRGALLEVDPELPLWDVTTLERRVSAATARTRVILGLLAAFGATALILTALGLWGVVAWAVTRRTREMGLRVALGAGRPGVVGLVARRPVRLVLTGAAVGLLAALGAGRLGRELLYGVTPGDPAVLVAATAVLLVVGAAAALIPALRASRVAPSEALRQE